MLHNRRFLLSSQEPVDHHRLPNSEERTTRSSSDSHTDFTTPPPPADASPITLLPPDHYRYGCDASTETPLYHLLGVSPGAPTSRHYQHHSHYHRYYDEEGNSGGTALSPSQLWTPSQPMPSPTEISCPRRECPPPDAAAAAAREARRGQRLAASSSLSFVTPTTDSAPELRFIQSHAFAEGLRGRGRAAVDNSSTFLSSTGNRDVDDRKRARHRRAEGGQVKPGDDASALLRKEAVSQYLLQRITRSAGTRGVDSSAVIRSTEELAHSRQGRRRDLGCWTTSEEPSADPAAAEGSSVCSCSDSATCECSCCHHRSQSHGHRVDLTREGEDIGGEEEPVYPHLHHGCTHSHSHPQRPIQVHYLPPPPPPLPGCAEDSYSSSYCSSSETSFCAELQRENDYLRKMLRSAMRELKGRHREIQAFTTTGPRNAPPATSTAGELTAPTEKEKDDKKATPSDAASVTTPAPRSDSSASLTAAQQAASATSALISSQMDRYETMLSKRLSEVLAKEAEASAAAAREQRRLTGELAATAQAAVTAATKAVADQQSPQQRLPPGCDRSCSPVLPHSTVSRGTSPPPNAAPRWEDELARAVAEEAAQRGQLTVLANLDTARLLDFYHVLAASLQRDLEDRVTRDELRAARNEELRVQAAAEGKRLQAALEECEREEQQLRVRWEECEREAVCTLTMLTEAFQSCLHDQQSRYAATTKILDERSRLAVARAVELEKNLRIALSQPTVLLDGSSSPFSGLSSSCQEDLPIHRRFARGHQEALKAIRAQQWGR